jgi:hypothetical protein
MGLDEDTITTYWLSYDRLKHLLMILFQWVWMRIISQPIG